MIYRLLYLWCQVYLIVREQGYGCSCVQMNSIATNFCSDEYAILGTILAASEVGPPDPENVFNDMQIKHDVFVHQIFKWNFTRPGLDVRNATVPVMARKNTAMCGVYIEPIRNLEQDTFLITGYINEFNEFRTDLCRAPVRWLELPFAYRLQLLAGTVVCDANSTPPPLVLVADRPDAVPNQSTSAPLIFATAGPP